MVIRPESIDEIDQIRAVNLSAFGRPEEGQLIDLLRERDAMICSLVAEVDGIVAGHVLFSPATLDDEGDLTAVAALGPVAVLSDYQRLGLGSALIREGLAICKERGYGIAVVLGHSSYYPRFGFRPSVSYGIRWEHNAPEEAFMVMELRPGALSGLRGVIRFLPEFDGV